MTRPPSPEPQIAPLRRQVDDVVRSTLEMRASVARDSRLAAQTSGPDGAEDARPADMPAVPGYRIVRPLGAGAFAQVWLAQTDAGEQVALKVGPLVDERRFELEVQALRALRGGHLVHYLDSGILGEQFWIAMQHVAGPTLADVLEQGPLPLETALIVAGEILEGLANLHREGFVHRDLKPANVLFDEAFSVRLADFGLARQRGEAGMNASLATVTAEGALVGTPLYMSPEQVNGAAKIGPASDIWSFGVLFYEMLCGEPPFQGRTLMALGAEILHGRIDIERREIPSGLQLFLIQCLRRYVDKRWHTADLALAAYRPCAEYQLTRIARTRTDAVWQRAVSAGLVQEYVRQLAARNEPVSAAAAIDGFISFAVAHGVTEIRETDLDQLARTLLPACKSAGWEPAPDPERLPVMAGSLDRRYDHSQKTSSLTWVGVIVAFLAWAIVQPMCKAWLKSDRPEPRMPSVTQDEWEIGKDRDVWRTPYLVGLSSRHTSRAFGKSRTLALDDWASLDAGKALLLAEWGKGGFTAGELHLNGLSELEPDAAAALALWGSRHTNSGDRYLHLNGLTSLTPAVASELLQWSGKDSSAERTLSLASLQEVEPEVIELLAKWEGKPQASPRDRKSRKRHELILTSELRQAVDEAKERLDLE